MSAQLTFASLLVGVFLSTILFGIICTQVTAYFQVYGRRDVAYLRLLVVYLFFVEIVKTVSEFLILFEPFVLEFQDRRALTISPKMLAADGITTVSISTPVQLYLAYRLRLVTRSSIIPAIIVFLSLGSMVGGVLVTFNTVRSPGFASFQSFSYAPTIWLACSALADVIITVSLVIYLSKNKTMGFDKLKSLMDKIIIATIQSGLITSVIAIATLVVFLAVPRTTLMFMWDFSLSRLYTSSLLSTLLARQHWNQLINRAASSTAVTPNVTKGDIEAPPQFPAGGRSTPIQVQVQTDTHSISDFDVGDWKAGRDL